LAGYVLSRLFRKPFLVTVRGLEALYLGERGGRKSILDKLLTKADAVITLSSELSAVVQDIGVKRERVRVVLNGVDSDIFRSVNRADVRKKLGLSPDRKIIISIGSLIERKGHHEIIKILPELNKRFDLEFYIIGDVGPEGDFSRVISKMIKNLDLSNVHLVNRVNHAELVDWYNIADLFCLATGGEGCPNVVMEALACGTPVVVTNVGAVPDLVVNGTNGYIVQNLNQLSSRIADALVMDWDREEIAHNAQSRTWDACAEDVIGIYWDLLDCYKNTRQR
jgi:glycosyltransferase involved in cell wall biosynthesis